MGSLLDKVGLTGTEVATGAATLSLLSFIYYDFVSKKQLRTKILRQLRSQQESNQENRNQLYLHIPVRQYWMRSTQKHPVYKIVVTGGPCGGKSSSFSRITKVFTEKGFRVLCVPEINTMVVTAGATAMFSRMTPKELIQYEAFRIRFQIFTEDYFTKLAHMANQPAIVLCDRGTVDSYAYVSNEYFQAMMDSQGWNWVSLRDKRYDLVCFLTSAANGAEKYYTNENNTARTETVEQAKRIDKRTLEAWTGHPHIVVAPNLPTETFDDKINRVVQAVRNMVGEELHTLVNHKLLIKAPIFPEGIRHEMSEIEQIFLINEDPKCKENKLKKRGSNKSYTYYQKYVLKTTSDEYIQELRKQLVPKQYMAMKELMSDKRYKPVVRQRIDFIWNNYSYCIDVYDNVGGQDKVYLLRFFARNKEGSDFVPPFIEVIRDVGNEKMYKLNNIALRHPEKSQN